MAEADVTPFEAGTLNGFLHRPTQEGGSGLVLTHGAGGDCTSPLLIEIARSLCQSGLAVFRCDLPFRRDRPKGPPSPATAAQDRAGLKSAVMALRKIVGTPVLLGGQSYGGRQASMLAADEPDLAAGLLLLSYPLHPPGKPEQLRTQHFPRLTVRTLFVQGTNDPFASVAELEAASLVIPAPNRTLLVEGAGHDLKRGRFDLALVVEGVAQLTSEAERGKGWKTASSKRPTRSGA